MKIIIFNNSGIVLKNNDYHVDIRTGLFAKELKKLGHDVVFFGQYITSTENTISKFRIIDNDLKVRGLIRKKNKWINYILLYTNAAVEIFRSDFIYIFYPSSYRLFAYWAKLIGRKYGLYIRGMKNRTGVIAHSLYKNAFVVFTVSDIFTREVNKVCQREVAFTIKPMLALESEKTIRGRAYYKKEKYQFLYLGRITKDKGLVELLHAVPELIKRGHNFSLKLVGDGEHYNQLKALADDLQVKEFVSFEGAVFNPENIKQYYTQSDIYIIPTYHEGFPRTIYEAIIFGTPIITTFVGGIPALMKDGYNCKEIKPKSISSIVDVLGFALNNYPEMGVLAKNAFQIVDKIFRPDKLSHAQDLNNKLQKL